MGHVHHPSPSPWLPRRRVDAARLGDDELVTLAVEGGVEARGEIYRRHRRAVWGRAYALTGRAEAADDITQDVFERAFRYLGGFRPGAPLRPWLQRIAANEAIDLLNAERSLAPLELAPEEGACDAEPGEPARVRAALARLTPERREAVVLRYWADLGGAEIARRLGVPVGTVHSRISRAMGDLRAILESPGF